MQVLPGFEGLLDAPPRTWFETFGPQGAPYRREDDPRWRRVVGKARELVDGALWLANIPPSEIGYMSVLADYGFARDEWDGAQVDLEDGELASIVGLDAYGLDDRDAAWLVAQAIDLEDRGGWRSRKQLEREIAEQLWNTVEAQLVLKNVPKPEADAFIRRHHSKFDYLNPRGLLYSIGAYYPPNRLIAVATANTPTGAVRRKNCPFDGVLELTRIASIGGLTRKNRKGRTVPVGASSALASRLLDMLPASGRRGQTGCLFLTYSLPEEKGTTYLSLVSKGLRPTRRTKVGGGGSRATATRSKPQTSKIAWEGGPAALPPDWSLVPAERRVGAQRAFAAWKARQK